MTCLSYSKLISIFDWKYWSHYGWNWTRMKILRYFPFSIVESVTSFTTRSMCAISIRQNLDLQYRRYFRNLMNIDDNSRINNLQYMIFTESTTRSIFYTFWPLRWKVENHIRWFSLVQIQDFTRSDDIENNILDPPPPIDRWIKISTIRIMKY